MEGILISESEVWEYEDRYQSARAILKQKHYPINWMKNSCSWFSQRLANELGKSTIQKYLRLFNYRNQDISGYTVNNPLPSFWLASSLKISPLEQLHFLEDLVNSKLPVTEESLSFTKSILYIEDLADGWKLYGKTGAANMRNPNQTVDANRKFGWFIGWLQNDTRTIFFVRYLEVYMPGSDYPSTVAREEVKEKLKNFLKIVF